MAQAGSGGGTARLRWQGYIAILRDAAVGGICTTDSAATGIFQRMRAWFGGGGAGAIQNTAQEFSFDVINGARWQCYQQGVLTREAENPLGMVPWVRYENAPDPAAGTRVGPAGSAAVDVGMGDVEPLIGLQDELNTRLSDRANRVTMTSFQMYLGKGIDDFVKRPIGPGQMWATDNLSAPPSRRSAATRRRPARIHISTRCARRSTKSAASRRWRRV